METIVKSAIVSHLQKDGFPSIAQELADLTSVHPSKVENEIDLEKSILRVLEEG